MKRKLIKFSNYSFCITLPKKAVDQMGWKKGDAVNVGFDDQTQQITIDKGKPRGNKSSRSDIKPIPKIN